MMKHVAERFVKSIDLNDHGTLFAGQGSSWMVEASFLSAGAAVKGEHQIVCRCIKNLEFLLPIPLGTLIHMESEITKVGTTSIQVHCEAVGVPVSYTHLDVYKRQLVNLNQRTSTAHRLQLPSQ